MPNIGIILFLKKPITFLMYINLASVSSGFLTLDLLKKDRRHFLILAITVVLHTLYRVRILLF